MSRPVLLALAVVDAGGAFLLARRAALRWQRQAAAAGVAEAERAFTDFRAALAPLGVSDRVARLVYDFFASRETPLDPGGVRPRASDGLAEQHFMGYPDEVRDALAALLSQLGRNAPGPTAAVWQIRTVADVAVWLEHRATAAERPA